MKKLSFLALAAAGMLMVGCADKDDEVKAGLEDQQFTDGAFIGVSLQLPEADNTTRADDDDEESGNDVLSNGTEDEFAVKNATLYIFKLAKTSSVDPDVAATYVNQVSLGTTYKADKEGGIDPDKWKEQEGVDDTKITSTYNEATLIPNELASEMKADTENNYYAYVIVNHNGQVPTNLTTSTTFATFSQTPFTEIGADIAAEKNIYESGLLMTNAPVCNYGGGSAAPAKPTTAGTDAPNLKYSTLVKLDNTKIFGSKTEAEQAPAACVYIERAAVKITVEDNRSVKKIGDLDVTILGWQVINTEPSYYNTRQINNNGSGAEDWGPYYNESVTKTNNVYRFVSKFPFNPTLPAGTSVTHTDGYRTYFAKDLQYATDADLLNTVASDDRPWIEVSPTKHAYTTENTFDVAHQTWKNTTMVTLKVRIGSADQPGFYTVGKGSQIMLTKETNKTAEKKAQDAIANIVKSSNDVTSAMTALRAKIAENNPNAEVASGLAVTFSTPSAAQTGVDFTVTPAFTITDNTGTNDATYLGDGEGELKAKLETAIKKAMYSNFNPEANPAQSAADLVLDDALLLSYYVGGVSYFNVRIKHFGEVETPWSPTLSAALEAANAGSGYIAYGGDGVNEIYFGAKASGTPTSDQVATGQRRFLGRYGVVRDNWYKLSIDKIGKIGDAEPVDPSVVTPDTPDDEIENFISVHVHIVPWVLRSQSVEF